MLPDEINIKVQRTLNRFNFWSHLNIPLCLCGEPDVSLINILRRTPAKKWAKRIFYQEAGIQKSNGSISKDKLNLDEKWSSHNRKLETYRYGPEFLSSTNIFFLLLWDFSSQIEQRVVHLELGNRNVSLYDWGEWDAVLLSMHLLIDPNW